MNIYIDTPRLCLRDWQEDDIATFAQMNSDQSVMEYFPNRLSYQQTVAFYERIRDELNRCGYGLYALVQKTSGSFIGYTGFHNVTATVDFAPAVEIGWRLCRAAWVQGHATEAAKACLEYAKTNLDFKEVVSFTSLSNKRSERVMQKIGMSRIKEFDHPQIPVDNPLCRHVLYQIEL